MPYVNEFGRFVVVTSITERKGKHPCYGWRRIALVEVDPEKKPAKGWKIDPRLRGFKRIITISEGYAFYTVAGWRMYCREASRLDAMAKKFDRLYPLHIMAKEWPLALPVYVD